MSLYGQASGNTLKGKINRLTELRGYSAYEIALIHGFVGTEEEWIDSITGGGGVRRFNGREGYVVPLAGDYTAEMVGARPNNWMPTYSDVGADKAGSAEAVKNFAQQKISTASVSLTTGWTGDASPYAQIVTISGMTATKMVDLQPTPEQIHALMENGTSGLQAVNNNGAVTVYAFGEKPAEAMTIQATLTEVV
jgi:hypothetical protein